MIYPVKIRVKVPGDALASEERRRLVHELVAKHGGRDATGANPRQSVRAVFRDQAAAKAFRSEARAALAGRAPGSPPG